MCGICGSLRLDAGPVAPADVHAMLEAMVHRGPDAGGMVVQPGIVAGIRRLAVIDLEEGDQPMANEDESVHVVFNGEIYNFEALRDELRDRGHRFRSRSDTEVLVHLWEEYGVEMVHRLNGMFAFCVHDNRAAETFVARDRLGIKPLYYALEAGRLAFASEIAVLLRHGAVSAEIDESSLVELFCLQYLSGEATVYRAIRKLLPGHAIHVVGGAPRIYRYYDIPSGDEPLVADVATLGQQLRELLDSSVRYRRIADVPLGVFLSGGLDSSIVVRLLSGMVDRPVRTFSVGFEGPAAFDERRHAARVAEHFGTEHRELIVSPLDIADYLPRLIEHLDEPVTDPAILPTYLLSEFARRHVTVVLTGEGADELFGGYKRYLYQSRFGWMSRVPGVRQAGQGALRNVLPHRVEQALEAVGQTDPARNHVRWAATVGSGVASRLFAGELYREYEDRAVAAFSGYFASGESRLADQLRADQHEWLPHNLLAKVDRASMAFSLEARVPFLDHRVVEWAARVPDRLKIDAGRTKHVLREAFRDELPVEIPDREKQGFDLPLGAWIRGPLRERVTDLLAPSNLGRWGALDAGFVGEMLDGHLQETQDFGLPLFNLLSIMIWLDRRR